jgi:hypothetical protein
MKTKPRIKSTHLIFILAVTAAMVSSLALVNLCQVQAEIVPAPTRINAATTSPNETQGTITFVAVSAGTLILAVIAFAWILKRTKKPSQKRVRWTTQA